jgi:hypothetical protein
MVYVTWDTVLWYKVYGACKGVGYTSPLVPLLHGRFSPAGLQPPLRSARRAVRTYHTGHAVQRVHLALWQRHPRSWVGSLNPERLLKLGTSPAVLVLLGLIPLVYILLGEFSRRHPPFVVYSHVPYFMQEWVEGQGVIGDCAEGVVQGTVSVLPGAAGFSLFARVYLLQLR